MEVRLPVVPLRGSELDIVAHAKIQRQIPRCLPVILQIPSEVVLAERGILSKSPLIPLDARAHQE